MCAYGGSRLDGQHGKQETIESSMTSCSLLGTMVNVQWYHM